MNPIRKVTLSLSLACLMLLALFATVALAGPTVVPANDNDNANLNHLRINEVRIDQGGGDIDEYFELAGAPGTTLDGLTYLVLGDSTAGGSGVIEAVVPLTGTVIPADGYYLALESTSMFTPSADLTTTLNFENSDNVTHLLVSDFTGSNGDDLDTNDDGILDVTPWTDLHDLIALIEEENPPINTEFHYGPPTVGPDGSFVPGQAYYCDVIGWQIGDFGTFTDDTPGAANNNCPAIEPDLTINKSGPSIALPGCLITYTINYQNIGLTATSGVTISDILPATYVTYVSDDSGLSCPSCSLGATGTLTWTAGTISPSDSLTFSLVALITDTIPAATVLTNTATIATSDNEITTTNNLSQWATIVTSLDLAVTKNSPALGMIEAPLSYTIGLQVTGIATATNVILTDVLPANTSYLADDSGYACPACSPGATGILTFTIGDLPANTATSFALTVTVESSAAPGEVLTNTITATTDSVGDNPANNSDFAETAVYPFVPIYDIQFVPDPVNDDASPHDGQIVWTAGVVTAQPGEIDTPSSLMVIQDPAGGPWSGVAVFRTNGFDGLIAPEGTSVLVLGTVSEFFGFTELNLDNDPWLVQVVETVSPLTPEVLTDTASFDDTDAAVSEQWEGVLIEFQDSSVTNEDLGFGEWYHDDSSGPSRTDDLGEQDGNLTYVPTLGDQFRYLRGIGWYSFGNYKLEPRYDADIALASDEPIITKAAPGIVGPNELYTYTITLENLLGFDLLGVAIGDLVPANATFAYALDGGSTIVSGTDTLVNWMIPILPDQSSVDVRFAVTSTNVFTEIVNEFYGVQAVNYPTITLGLPITTLVSSPLRIHDIQGEGHFSPYEGFILLDIPGIVTVVRSNSFYMQDPNPDSNDSTSEGINVFTGGAPGVNVGASGRRHRR